MKAVKETVRKYYKYNYQTFVQPVMTADASMGGDVFGIEVSNNATWGGYPAFQAFDGNTSTFWLGAHLAAPDFFFYNPNPICITKIEVPAGWAGNQYLVSGELYGSNDNSTWTKLGDSAYFGSAGFTFDIPSNTQYFTYYKIHPISVGYHGWSMNEMTITATEKVTIESTSSDYDFYKDIPTYKVIKETVRKYFKQIFEQSTAGEYSVNLTNNEYLVELYGAGGGCANGTWLTDTGYFTTMGGGSGAGYKGIISLPAGSYIVTVGAAGTDKLNGINERNQVAQAGAGGSTSIGSLISCGGGGGAYVYYGNATAGTGGTVTISSSLEEMKVLNSVSGNSNGTAVGGARAWGPGNCNGATSVYDNTLTGYGAGGGYPTGAKDGSCKIYILSNESDYDIYKDITTHKVIKKEMI